jgi:hypothetical protein
LLAQNQATNAAKYSGLRLTVLLLPNLPQKGASDRSLKAESISANCLFKISSQIVLQAF